MTLRLRYAAVSDVGMVRQDNEDSAYAGPNLLLLADGMGGHAGGEVASATAVASMRDLQPPAGGGDPTETLRSGVASAGEQMRALVRARPELEGMGTTLTLLMHSGEVIAIAQVGDSRGYLLRDGVLEQVTHDQTFVQSLIDQGRISDEDAKTHPQRNMLLQALDGRVEVEPEVVLRTPRLGDRYLLCSDGLSSVVSEPTIRDVLEVGTPREAADRLVDLALRAGAPDNVTCLVADVVDEDDDVAPPVAVVVGAAADSAHARGVGVAAANVSGNGSGDSSGAAGSETVEPSDHEDDDPGHGGGSRGLRLLLPVVALLVLVAAAGFGGYRWTQTQYYVGVDGGQVVIYRGVPQKLVGRSLSQVVEPSDVQASTLPSFSQGQLNDTIAASSLDEARRIVDHLRTQATACAGVPAP
ncbi:MAG: PP2C family protein-serine/threonine phosphatase, partial [Actinomycetes bacterium]